MSRRSRGTRSLLPYLFGFLLGLGPAAFLLGGCPRPLPDARLEEFAVQSPDWSRVALVVHDRTGFRLVVREISGRLGRESETSWPAPVWESVEVPPLYVFWLDDSTIEVLVAQGDRPGFGTIGARTVDGVGAVTRAIPSTEMRTVLASQLLPELRVRSLD